MQKIDVINERGVSHQVDPIFPNRWSRRAMSGEEVSKEELLRLFEAARWAPSSFNNQPWRFIYTVRGTTAFNDFLGLLDEGNMRWAKNAAALVIVASKKIFEKTGRPARTHSFDAGAAWENVALQASRMGLVAHGMEGFDYERAADVAQIPGDEFTVEAMVAIGKQGHTEELTEKLQSMEHPNNRKPVEEFAFEGRLRPSGI